MFIHALLTLDSGVSCPCYGDAVSHTGVEVRTASHLVRWDWGPPTLHRLDPR